MIIFDLVRIHRWKSTLFVVVNKKKGQLLDEYVTELRKLSKHCEFTDVDKEILLVSQAHTELQIKSIKKACTQGT